MTIEEMEEELTRPGRKVTPAQTCDPCVEANRSRRVSYPEGTVQLGPHYYRVNRDGVAEFVTVTEDGRVVKAEDAW